MVRKPSKARKTPVKKAPVASAPAASAAPAPSQSQSPASAPPGGRMPLPGLWESRKVDANYCIYVSFDQHLQFMTIQRRKSNITYQINILVPEGEQPKQEIVANALKLTPEGVRAIFATRRMGREWLYDADAKGLPHDVIAVRKSKTTPANA